MPIGVRKILTVLVLAACSALMLAGGDARVSASETPNELTAQGFPIMPYAAAGRPDPSASLSRGTGLVKVYSMSGELTGVARWDGESIEIARGEPGWTIPLTVTVQGLELRLELDLRETRSARPGGAGRVRICLSAAGNLSIAHEYSYVLALSGGGAWIAEDQGSAHAAVLKSGVPGSSGLTSYMVAYSTDDSVDFRSGSVEAKLGDEAYFVEAASWPAGPDKANARDSRLLTIDALVVNAWSEEPVLALASTLAQADSKPDVRVFGAVDKETASPGDALTYTYYLFNAGTSPAVGVSISLPIPQGAVFAAYSLHGNPGAVLLHAEADREVDAITWSPTEDLDSGDIVAISLSIIVEQTQKRGVPQ